MYLDVKNPRKQFDSSSRIRGPCKGFGQAYTKEPKLVELTYQKSVFLPKRLHLCYANEIRARYKRLGGDQIK